MRLQNDIAGLVKDWWTQGPILHKIFEEFGQISNLHLNMKKTICIPLWPQGRFEIAQRLPSHIPGWHNLEISDKGTYLGFVTGPGKGKDSWKKPMDKFQDRVTRWATLGAGMQYGALTYNVFALSTLLYVGQLEPIPETALA